MAPITAITAIPVAKGPALVTLLTKLIAPANAI